MLKYFIEMSDKLKNQKPLMFIVGLLALFSIGCNAEVEKENLQASPENPVNPVYKGGDLDAEARLESIKQALVDITLGSEIELSSAAYLDDSGVLREASVMTTKAKVRGVRVLSYVKAAAGIAEADLSAEILSNQSCPGGRSSLIREAVVQVAQNYKNHRVGNHYLNEINELLENTVVDKLSSVEGWTVSGFSVCLL